MGASLRLASSEICFASPKFVANLAGVGRGVGWGGQGGWVGAGWGGVGWGGERGGGRVWDQTPTRPPPQRQYVSSRANFASSRKLSKHENELADVFLARLALHPHVVV